MSSPTSTATSAAAEVKRATLTPLGSRSGTPAWPVTISAVTSVTTATAGPAAIARHGGESRSACGAAVMPRSYDAIT